MYVCACMCISVCVHGCVHVELINIVESSMTCKFIVCTLRLTSNKLHYGSVVYVGV